MRIVLVNTFNVLSVQVSTCVFKRKNLLAALKARLGRYSESPAASTLVSAERKIELKLSGR